METVRLWLPLTRSRESQQPREAGAIIPIVQMRKLRAGGGRGGLAMRPRSLS